MYEEYIKIQKKKEGRLWMTQVWMPICSVIGVVLYFEKPLEKNIKKKFNEVKDYVKDRIN